MREQREGFGVVAPSASTWGFSLAAQEARENTTLLT